MPPAMDLLFIAHQTFPAATLLFFFFLLLLLLPVAITRRRSSSATRSLPPSPPKLPLIGNLHQLGSVAHRSLAAMSSKYGPLMYLHLGQVPTLVVSSADMAKEVMRTHDHVFGSRPSLKAPRILLYGSTDLAFAPYGEHWRRLRKLYSSHILSSHRVQSYEQLRNEEVASMITKISGARRSEVDSSIDVSAILNALSKDVICRVVSWRLFREENRNQEFCKLIQELFQLLDGFYFEDYFPSLAWLDELFGLSRKANDHSRKWDAILDQLIDDHRDQESKKDHSGEDFVDVLLSLCEDSGHDFSPSKEELKAVLVDMFIGGTETSYIALEWAMSELVRNPEAMKKLQEEVRRIAAGKRTVTVAQLKEMVYLKAVLKEAMRLHPPIPLLVIRESLEDCQLNGYRIPESTRTVVNAWAIGRDAMSWEAPEKFSPERFMNSEVDFRGKNFELIPFGAGRRICPGMHFAVCNVELALANLVLQFDWGLPRGLRREEMDMEEAPGMTTRRRHRLRLVAKPFGGC